MKDKIKGAFNASVNFEYTIEIDGYSYLVIYGKHINGYFCCVPNWSWGCEMAQPIDVAYNSEKLITMGVDKKVAKILAESIRFMSETK